MRHQLDRTDERILDALRANARASHAELALRVNLSRSAVRRRIERLERDGFIGGYTLAPSRGAMTSARQAALIFVYRHDRLRGRDVMRLIRSFPEVVACEVLSGDFDLMVRVESDTADRVQAVWEGIAKLPEVKDTVTSFVLARLQG